MANYNPQERHPQVRLRNRILAAAVLMLAAVNGVAGYFDLHDTVTIFVLNIAGVALFVAAVILELRRMIPRKRWRALSFLMPSLGVILLFCARVVDSEGSANATTVLLALGGVVIFYGVVCALKWRRYSLARKAQLQEARQREAEK
ncbi:MAG: hypothetical protein IKA01_08715 [Alistipes sp.]|nr:hypothetical protein [Alistipes sp.]MBR2629855.1 hypothetical protein [Alistipes sp.]